MRNAVLAAIVLGSSVCACVERSYPHGPVAATTEQGGWVRVEEPGWLTVEMPARPAVREAMMASSAGTFGVKDVVAHAGAVRYEVHYGDSSSLPDADRLFAEGHGNWAQGRGVTIRDEKRLERGGARALELDLLFAPDSEFNGTKEPAVCRVRMFVVGKRYVEQSYVALASDPHEADAARFFDSLVLAR